MISTLLKIKEGYLALPNKNTYKETLYNGYSQEFDVDEILFEDKSEHQHLILFKSKLHGKVLALDGAIQTTQSDEAFYHEMLSHVPLISIEDPKKVLIIGGGDGGIAREVLRHKSIEKVVMIEIDSSVIEFSKKYLSSISDNAFDNSKLEVIIEDGAKYVSQTKETFDVIIVDSTDPVGPAEVLFRQNFYKNCHDILTSGGILVTQNGVPFMQPDELKTTYSRLKPVFKHPTFYVAVVPTYIGGFMTLSFSSNSDYSTLSQQVIEQRWNAVGYRGKYYNPAIHKAAFALPNFISDIIKD